MREIYIRIGRVMYPVLLPLMRVFLRRSTRVYVVIVYERQVLLIKNWLARDTWRFPGGGVGKSETEEQAAIREVKEELRLVLQGSKLTKLNSGVMETDSLGYPYTNFLYSLDTFPRRLEDQYEIVDFGLFEAIPDDIQPEIRATLELLKEKELI